MMTLSFHPSYMKSMEFSRKNHKFTDIHRSCYGETVKTGQAVLDARRFLEQ